MSHDMCPFQSFDSSLRNDELFWADLFVHDGATHVAAWHSMFFGETAGASSGIEVDHSERQMRFTSFHFKDVACAFHKAKRS